MKISQLSFAGGMTGQYDPTKTDPTQYRVGLNCRVRKNAIEGAYAPVRIPSPATTHQALFALDDKLILISGATMYQVRPDLGDVHIIASTTLNPTADYIYHVNVPAPSNFIMKMGGATAEYNSAVSTMPECAVLQDGISQPYLLASNLSYRAAHTYVDWSFDFPEYVPVGKQMCFSGNKLYIVSPNGRRIYQSVSGRPLDCVINVDGTTGEKQGDADTTYIAVAAAPATAISANQGGGFLAFTYYGAYAGYIDAAVDSYFGEPYIQPAELFPVGAVGQYGFAYSNGQSVFVSPSGIQSFNQVAQQFRESNNTPFGAAIVDYIIRPITRVATAVADDYIFFGLKTIFGDGILVYDTRLSAFVSIDLVGEVKEFAVLRTGGLDRVFYITTANELYELPLYSGTRSTFSVALGHYSKQDGGTQLRPCSSHVALTGIISDGSFSMRTYVDSALVNTSAQTVDREMASSNILDVDPLSIMFERGAQAMIVNGAYKDMPYGYSVAFIATCSADARLTTFAGILQERTVDLPVVDDIISADQNAQTFLMLGNIQPDSTQHGTTFTTAAEKYYVFCATDGDSTLLNDGWKIPLFQRQAKRFTTASEQVTATATATVYDYSTLWALLDNETTVPSSLFILGNLGPIDYHTSAWAAISVLTEDINAVISDMDQTTTARKKDFMACEARPAFYLVSTDYVDFYCVNFPLPTADMTIDAEGNLPVTPTDMQEGERVERWIETNIAQRNNGKFNVVVFGYPPYSGTAKFGPGLATLRWNYSRLGVCAVIANSTAYERTVINNVYYINVGTGSQTASLEIPTGDGLAVPGYLKLVALPNNLSFEFIDENGKVCDRASILS